MASAKGGGEMICPYRDEDSVVMRSPVRTEFDDLKHILVVVREVFCPDCRRTSYGIRLIKDGERDYDIIRRDELKDRTGIRIVHASIFRRGCRWSGFPG